MLIYTSYFAQVKNLPSDIVPISIAAKQVPGWRYPVYKALAPTYNILYDYKRDGDKDHYVAAILDVPVLKQRLLEIDREIIEYLLGMSNNAFTLSELEV